MDKNNKSNWASELTMVTLILIAILLVLPLTCARACSLAHEDGAVIAEDVESSADEHILIEYNTNSQIVERIDE